ncbi:P-loop NTPase fold protein (plasmid) [Rhizobium sp. CB3171]|uniref:KAP family P-loop NTPase fold protein n=1 Tax=Rhizobium sp. CB3171 TaxID=3039157 RepID=UPI0024B05A98|nr:P-loop NTPase fold protein [Rhizobium sp. CB3171]WFU04521.1 P-loop NTPase fold protein [Rhizobium sp. CB3171]
MWADSESKIDYLNYSEVSEMVCDMVTDDAMLPISLGIYGTWGVGKSSILQLIAAQLNSDRRNLIVPFDAWLYQDFEEAKAALMTVIAKTVYDNVPEGFKEKAAGLYRRVNKLKALGLIADVGAFLAGVPTLGMFSKAADAASDAWDGTSDEEDVETLKGAVAEAGKRTSGLLKPKEKRNAPEEIVAFRKEFGELLKSVDRRLIVFVDNLDRCLPPNAISTLEAMRLFLFLPNTAFIVAADEDMIRLAVAKHFKDPGDRHITDYLDKLIQVPLRVPKLGLQEVRAYLFMLAAAKSEIDADKVEDLRKFLIEKLRRSWSDEPPFDVKQALAKLAVPDGHELRNSLETMDRLAGILAHSMQVNGNPRIVKRMLNVIRMRASVARRRGMALDESIIAKLALFERCTSEDAIRTLNAMVQSAPDGKPRALVQFEAVTDRVQTEVLPKDWQKHAEFISDWLKLHPPLGGIDLRPAVYLSRETIPVRVAINRMSEKTRNAIEVLLKTATLSSRASKAAVEEIDVSEVGEAINEIIAVMKRNPDWDKARDDFRGAHLLAQRHEDAHRKLVAFVETLPKVPRWMTALMKDDGAGKKS